MGAACFPGAAMEGAVSHRAGALASGQPSVEASVEALESEAAWVPGSGSAAAM